MAISYHYEDFISKLNKGIEGKILGYDTEESTGRCVIFLKTTDQKVFIDQAATQEAEEGAISFLRARIRQGIEAGPVLTLFLRDGSLTLEEGPGQ